MGRSASGFTLRVIDTPGLLDGDTVNEEALNVVCGFLADKEVDAVLFVDRLDTYRLSTLDHQIIETLTARFGPLLWNLVSAYHVEGGGREWGCVGGLANGGVRVRVGNCGSGWLASPCES